MIVADCLPLAPLRTEQLSALLGKPQQNERRGTPRHTFFSPISLRTADCPTHLLTAFSREVSLSGIGLLHGTPIEEGCMAAITIVTPELHIAKSAEAMWCRQMENGWYLSGWRFVSAQ